MTQSNAALAVNNQQRKGAQLQSLDKFLYGKFECFMRPGFGSGIISSFFLFDDTKGFEKNWQEIDCEPMGMYTNLLNTNVIRTVNGKIDRNVNVQQTSLNYRTSDKFWKLEIDWNPDRVIWKVDDVIIRTMVVSLKQPMKIMLNIWQSDKKDWAGEFKAGLLPQIAQYKYVKYTSLDGRAWSDYFGELDPRRWMVGTWPLEATQLVAENVIFKDGSLTLKLT